MYEKRLTARLVKYWELVRKDKNLPEIQHLNPGALEDIWPQCFMVSVDRKGALTFKYEYMGQPIAETYGRDLTGQVVSLKMAHFPGSVVLKHLAVAASSTQPFEDQGHFVSEQGKIVKYRACYLPFGTKKKGLTHVVVGLSCRVY